MQKITALIICYLLTIAGINADALPKVTASNTLAPSTEITTITPKPTDKTTAAPTAPPTTPSTTSAPVTTPAPVTTTPLPHPSTGKWIVNDKNHTCIIMQMAAEVTVMYPDANNKSSHIVVNIPPPPESYTFGSCNEKDENLTITWKSPKALNNNSVIIHFEKFDQLYSIHHIEVSIDNSSLPDSKINQLLHFTNNKTYYNTSLGNSYRCARLQTFTLNSTNPEYSTTNATLKVQDLQFQAYKTENDGNFGLAQDCAFDTPDIVPIAVGCVLGGLVIIVLAAYLISRRRSQARGYLSM